VLTRNRSLSLSFFRLVHIMHTSMKITLDITGSSNNSCELLCIYACAPGICLRFRWELLRSLETIKIADNYHGAINYHKYICILFQLSRSCSAFFDLMVTTRELSKLFAEITQFNVMYMLKIIIIIISFQGLAHSLAVSFFI
jgi:hypothetical protein